MTQSAHKPMLLAVGVAACVVGARAARRRRGTRLGDLGPLRRVVILGAGFGGLAAAKRLAGRAGIDFTVIDVRNHHLFQPLLYQVATAALSPGDIASPVRGILPVSPRVRVMMERVAWPRARPLRSSGDAALALSRDGKPLPALAPVAYPAGSRRPGDGLGRSTKQQGEFAALAILRRLHGQSAPRAFVYRDYGTLATIGRNKAVAEFGALRITGFIAWITWAVAHIFFLIGFRNPVLVSAQWLFAYVTHDWAARLIIGPEPARRDSRSA